MWMDLFPSGMPEQWSSFFLQHCPAGCVAGMNQSACEASCSDDFITFGLAGRHLTARQFTVRHFPASTRPHVLSRWVRSLQLLKAPVNSVNMQGVLVEALKTWTPSVSLLKLN